MSSMDHGEFNSFGADIRSLRKLRGMTLSDVAEKMNKSVGWVSQIERDLSEPKPEDLQQLSLIFGVALSTLLHKSETPDRETGRIVRQGQGRKIAKRAAGLVERLLSPDLTDDFEVVHSVFEPNSKIPKPMSRPTQEVAYLISGKLDITIDGEHFHITQGDSFRIRGEVYTWANPYDEPAIAIWVIAPPVY